MFQAELADGSQALYAATIGGTRCPLSHGYGKYVRDRDITQYERYMLPPPPSICIVKYNLNGRCVYLHSR